MATYDNDLRLTELTTGDEVSSWGDVANTNLELIADSLGYGTQDCFSTDSNSTTTVPDGSADPSRAMYFKVTSSATLTTTRVLTIAPNTISRLMWIENATTGSQSIDISQGSGANVTIPTGTAKLVYFDGAGAGAAVVDTGTLTTTDIGSTVLAFDSNLQSFVTALDLPTADGTSGQALLTNGSGVIAFGDVDALPSQTGNSGYYLTTDGTTASWGVVSIPSYTYVRTNFTATAAQTTFTVAYTVGYVDVYMNGVKLIVGTDVTATNGTSIVLASGAAVGDLIEVVAFETFNVANALTNTDIGVSVQGYDADTTTATNTQTLTNKTVRSTVYALAGTAFDATNGEIQTKTITVNTTFTETLSAGDGFVLMLTDAGSYTITWPTVTWVTSAGNVAPTLTAADSLVFWKVSTTLYGAYVGNSV